MIEELSSRHFAPLIDREITLKTESGDSIRAVVVEVLENPKGRPRRAPASRRTPFSVLLAGPAQARFIEGACTLQLPEPQVEVSLHVNRIASVDGTHDQAWYEIAFC